MTREEAIGEIKSWTPILLRLGDKCTNKTAIAQHMAIEALEQEPCDKYIKEIDHLHKYISKLETQIVMQEPCEDCISIQAVIDIIEKEEFKGDALSEIEKLPSVNPQRTGHWIYELEDWNRWTCSECGWSERTDVHITLGYNFCPNCGAKMESVRNRNDKRRNFKYS